MDVREDLPRSELQLAYFSYDSKQDRLTLRSCSRPEVAPLHASVSNGAGVRCAIGLEMEMVQHAAKTGQPVYLPDCRADARWVVDSEIRSIYIVPVSTVGACDVLVLASREVDGISRRERTLANVLVRHIGEPDRSAARHGSRVAFLERGLRRIKLEIAQLTAGSDAGSETIPHGLSERLRLLSPREWQVMERLRSGLRVVTIATELTISPNTVRNHLKSIYRKLGVRSQVELLERMRGAAAQHHPAFPIP